jgi:high-affinity Fe2+/Pb2+ permease
MMNRIAHIYLGNGFWTVFASAFLIALLFHLQSIRRQHRMKRSIRMWKLLFPIYVCVVFAGVGLYEVFTHPW